MNINLGRVLGRVLRGRVLRYGLAVVALAAGVRLVPHWWCERGAVDWYRGGELPRALGRGTARWIAEDLSEQDFTTGHSKYDGEWLFATYMMAGMGFGQLALSDPGRRQEHLRLLDRCVERLISPQLRRFDALAWGDDPLESLARDDKDHAAYLGYLNLLLSLQRRLDPGRARHARLNDRVTRALVRRLEASPLLLLRSYPAEVFPVDNAAVVGSIGLHDRATGADHSRLLERWASRLSQRAVDRASGLLFQQVHHRSGAGADAPRASGTALAVYFLSFSHPRLSAALYQALRTRQADTLLGFGVVREYGPGHAGCGDIDSGPVVLGYGVSATGFSLGASRIHGDEATFRRLFGTLHLFGAPVRRGDRLELVTGGPLGNALMLAMLTAPRPVNQTEQPR